jgi:hypothetical protein
MRTSSGARKFLVRLLVGAAFMLIPLGQAAAQTLTDTETATPGNYAGGGGAQATVTFSATLQNAISLSLVGIADGAATTTIGGAGAAGTVAFGNFNTLCSAAVTTGECVRATAGTTGAHLVASFRATVAFSGAASADLGISKNAAGVSPFDVKFATGIGTAWTNSGDGTALLDPLTAAAETNLGAALVSGATVDHQVAVYFADTMTPGAYNTTVRWTATAN